MNDAALLLDVSSLSTTRRAIRSMSSARRVGVVAGLALATMLPVTAPAAAQEQEPVAARIARENLPSVVTLIALDDRDQPLALGSGFFITRDGVLVASTAQEGLIRLVQPQS